MKMLLIIAVMHITFKRTFVPLLLRISGAHTIQDVARVMYFKHAHRVETQQNIELMTFAVT